MPYWYYSINRKHSNYGIVGMEYIPVVWHRLVPVWNTVVKYGIIWNGVA